MRRADWSADETERWGGSLRPPSPILDTRLKIRAGARNYEEGGDTFGNSIQDETRSFWSSVMSAKAAQDGACCRIASTARPCDTQLHYSKIVRASVTLTDEMRGRLAGGMVGGKSEFYFGGTSRRDCARHPADRARSGEAKQASCRGRIARNPARHPLTVWRNSLIFTSSLKRGDVTPSFPPAGIRAGRLFALLPNLGPLGSRVFRLSQIRWAGCTG